MRRLGVPDAMELRRVAKAKTRLLSAALPSRATDLLSSVITVSVKTMDLAD